MSNATGRGVGGERIGVFMSRVSPEGEVASPTGDIKKRQDREFAFVVWIDYLNDIPTS